MTKLNNHLIDNIYNVLEESDLGLANFDVKLPCEGDTFLEIKFKPDPSYKINFQYHENGSNRYISSLAIPGRYLKLEESRNFSLSEITSYVLHWSDSLDVEIKSHGVREPDLDEFSEQIDELVNSEVQNPKSPFTSIEVEVVRKKLADLEKRFETLQKDKQLTNIELEKLKKQIQKASEDIPSLPKGMWYKISLNRILGTLKNIMKSKEGREVITEAVKKCLV